MHPLTIIFYILIVFCICITFNNPVYMLIVLIFAVLNIAMAGGIKQLKTIFTYSLYAAIGIFIINCLVCSQGDTLVPVSYIIPQAKNIKITIESLMFSTVMAIKLICIFVIFTFYNCVADSDEIFGITLRRMPKTAITLSLSVNMLHRLKIEADRIKGVMISRGAQFDNKSIYKRIKSYYPMLKVIILSSLEGALITAEAIYTRGYGKCKRTNYFKLRMGMADYAINLLNLLLFCIFIYGLFHGAGNYRFYPTLQAINRKHIAFATAISANLLLIVISFSVSKRFAQSV